MLALLADGISPRSMDPQEAKSAVLRTKAPIVSVSFPRPTPPQNGQADRGDAQHRNAHREAASTAPSLTGASR